MHASETAKRMVQVAAVKAQVEAITRRLRATVDELEEAVRAMPNGEEGDDDEEAPDA
jgi:predicted phage gp36 major capsid-like protein